MHGQARWTHRRAPQGLSGARSVPLPHLRCQHQQRVAGWRLAEQWASPGARHQAMRQHPQCLPSSVRTRALPDTDEQLQNALEAATPAYLQATEAAGGLPELPVGTVLKDKYTIQGVLGTGQVGQRTYQASGPDGQRVAIKALSLKAAKDWKQLELFQREAQTLEALNHPGIPRYVDYFEVDTPSDRAFYLVQEEAKGKSLAQLISEGKRCTTQQATRRARELCEILAYLSSLHPPVVHRDVKPENIVLEGGTFDGRVFLIDFGGVVGVASAASASQFMSTVIGTYGYMAPEQFRGQAQPASDMYALGCTLLYLLSGQPPFAFPQERMRIAWRAGPERGGVTFQPPSPMWGTLLDGLLEPVAEDRVTAQQALALLDGKALTRPAARPSQSTLTAPLTPGEARRMRAMQLSRITGVPTKPAGSKVLLERSVNRLDITIPPKGIFSADALMTGGFAIAWNAFVAVWTVGAITSGGLLMALFSLPFWFAGVQLGRQTFGSALLKERLAIGRNKFRLGQELALFNKDGQADFDSDQGKKVIEGLTADLRGARVITTVFVNGEPQTAIELIEGIRKHRFGEGLDLAEQQWLCYEINSQIEQMQGQPIDYDSLPEMEIPQEVNNNNTSSEP